MIDCVAVNISFNCAVTSVIAFQQIHKFCDFIGCACYLHCYHLLSVLPILISTPKAVKSLSAFSREILFFPFSQYWIALLVKPDFLASSLCEKPFCFLLLSNISANSLMCIDFTNFLWYTICSDEQQFITLYNERGLCLSKRQFITANHWTMTLVRKILKSNIRQSVLCVTNLATPRI